MLFSFFLSAPSGKVKKALYKTLIQSTSQVASDSRQTLEHKGNLAWTDDEWRMNIHMHLRHNWACRLPTLSPTTKLHSLKFSVNEMILFLQLPYVNNKMQKIFFKHISEKSTDDEFLWMWMWPPAVLVFYGCVQASQHRVNVREKCGPS